MRSLTLTKISILLALALSVLMHVPLPAKSFVAHTAIALGPTFLMLCTVVAAGRDSSLGSGWRLVGAGVLLYRLFFAVSLLWSASPQTPWWHYLALGEVFVVDANVLMAIVDRWLLGRRLETTPGEVA